MKFDQKEIENAKIVYGRRVMIDFDSPITARENFHRALEHKQLWMPMGGDYRSFDDSTDDLWRGFKLRLDQREIARDSHDKQEERKHKIARCHTVPLGVLKHLERFAPAVIHQNHTCYSNTTQDIEREKTLTTCHFSSNIND